MAGSVMETPFVFPYIVATEALAASQDDDPRELVSLREKSARAIRNWPSTGWHSTPGQTPPSASGLPDPGPRAGRRRPRARGDRHLPRVPNG